MLVDGGELWSGYCREGLYIKEEDTKFYNIRTTPFKIYGLVAPMNIYNRITKDIAAKISGGVIRELIKIMYKKLLYSKNKGKGVLL